MKTNVQIDITDDQRQILANLIDQKKSARKISRKEVIALCEQHINGLINVMPEPEASRTSIMVGNAKAGSGLDIYKPDPEDIPLMAQPNNPGYVRGWNLVKRSKKQ